MMQSILLAGSGGGLTLQAAVSGAGLGTNLVVCVDAGDFQSYSSTSSQSWVNRATAASAFALVSSPVFNGAIGYLPAYWSLNGLQYFTYQATNLSSVETFHKDNASWSAFALVYFASQSLGTYFWGDAANAGVGMALAVDTSSRPVLVVTGTAGALVLAVTASAQLSPGWHGFGVSVSEAMGASGGFFYLDGAYSPIVGGASNFTATYASPSANNSANRLAIGAQGALSNLLPNGARLSAVAFWAQAITKANFDTVWALVKSRFGL